MLIFSSSLLKMKIFFYLIQVISTYFMFCELFANAVSGGLYNADCRLVKCETELSFEHAVDIAMIPVPSVSEKTCLSKMSKVDLQDFFAVYCHNEYFCGLDVNLDAGASKGLGFNRSASCDLYGANEIQCQIATPLLKQQG